MVRERARSVSPRRASRPGLPPDRRSPFGIGLLAGGEGGRVRVSARTLAHAVEGAGLAVDAIGDGGHEGCHQLQALAQLGVEGAGAGRASVVGHG